MRWDLILNKSNTVACKTKVTEMLGMLHFVWPVREEFADTAAVSLSFFLSEVFHQ